MSRFPPPPQELYVWFKDNQTGEEKGVFQVQRSRDRGRDPFFMCRCGATIVWTITKNDKRMPVDAMPDKEGIYTSHLATCPSGRRKEHR